MRRALFIKTKNLGDAVVLTSAIRAMPGDFIIDVLCFDDCSDLYKGISAVGNVWSVKRGLRGTAAIREGLRLALRLKKTKFDLLCQFSDDWRGALLSRWLNPVGSVATKNKKRPKLWHNSFKILANRPNHRRHAAELDVDLLRVAGIYQGGAPSYIPPYDKHDRASVESYLLNTGVSNIRYAVLHLCSRWRFKEIAIDTSRELICGLRDRGFYVILTGNRADEIRLREITNGLPEKAIRICAGKSIGFFSEIINRASLVVSIDSLATHLSSAHLVKTVAIFGPSGELNWHPWKTEYRVVAQSEKYPCRPCGLDGCAGSKVSECLRTLASQQILLSVDDILNQ